MLREAGDKTALMELLVLRLPQIYRVLREVQDIVIPKPVKAMLASYLVNEWTNSDAQVDALRKGLGLTPSAEDAFWTAVAGSTKNLKPRDKIVFLSDVVPLFGTGSEALAQLPSLLPLLVEAIRNKLPETPPEDVELLATELAATDFLRAGRPNAGERLLRFVMVNRQVISSQVLMPLNSSLRRPVCRASSRTGRTGPSRPLKR